MTKSDRAFKQYDFLVESEGKWLNKVVSIFLSIALANNNINDVGKQRLGGQI